MVVYEYYTPTANYETNVTSTLARGQTFTVGAVSNNEAHTLTSIILRVRRVGNPGLINVRLYATVNGKPTGPALSTGSFDGDAISTSAANKDITMSSYILRRNTQYAICIFKPGGDGSNQLFLSGRTYATYAGGTSIGSSDGGTSWSTDSHFDFYFIINGTLMACADWTTQADCESEGCYWYEGSCHTIPFFAEARDDYTSGFIARYQKRQLVGFFPLSGETRSIITDVAGRLDVVVASGIHIIAESGLGVLMSGQHVWISGQHVFVESGAYNLTQITSGAIVVDSGLHVQVSGQHVHLESGDTINVYTMSGSEVRTLPNSETMLVDQSGNIAAISQRHEGLVVTTDITREVHKGGMFHYSHMHSGVESDANSDTLIFVASGKEIHTKFAAMAEAAFRTALYEKPTCSNSGTPQLGCDGPNCMNRNISGGADSLFSEGPTVTNLGCKLFVGVGGIATEAGDRGGGAGTVRQDTEWILNGASGMTEYLFRVTNTDAAAKDVAKAVEFSEEDPIYWS